MIPPNDFDLDQTDFDTPEDAITHALTALVYSRSTRDTANYLVDEGLPSRGWKVVKMTDEEREAWEGDYAYTEEELEEMDANRELQS